VLQILNYSMRAQGHPVSVMFPVRYRAARLWGLDGKAPVPLKAAPTGAGQPSGIEIHLPPLQAYAAMELEA
jgi:hypothetical protein